MARIRSIKPEFWTDLKIANLPKSTALFFIALWNFVDDQGIIENDSKALSLSIPLYRSQDIKKMLISLWKSGLISCASICEQCFNSGRTQCEQCLNSAPSLVDIGVTEGCSRGVQLVFINGWRHQRIDKPRDGKFKDKEIKWLPYVIPRSFDDHSKIIPRKDRIGLDKIGEEGIYVAKKSDDFLRTQVISISDDVKKIKKPRKKVEPTLSSQSLKKIYAESFRSRYGSDPAWAAKENALANKLIASVGLEIAFKLAEYYPTYIEPWHVKQRHPFALLAMQYHQVLTDMQNIKHVVNARSHEKVFDQKVEEFQHAERIATLRQKEELSLIAFKWAKQENPNLKDYQFELDQFLEFKNIPKDLPYSQLKEILDGHAHKEIGA